MNWKQKIGYLQIPVSAAGILILTVSVLSALSVEPPVGDGFEGGLVYFFLYISAGFGFFLTVTGLAIPVKEEMRGIHFTGNQRKLLLVSLASAAASVVSPLMIWRISLMLNISPGEFAAVWLLFIVTSLASLGAALLWRFWQVLDSELH